MVNKSDSLLENVPSSKNFKLFKLNASKKCLRKK